MIKLTTMLVMLIMAIAATAASAATPNESGAISQLQSGGTWSNNRGTPIYRDCVSFKPQPAPWQPCGDNNYQRVNVLVVNDDLVTPKNATMSKAMGNVPIPVGFHPSTNPDHQAVVFNYIENRYCDFWEMSINPNPRQPDGSFSAWRTKWGGCVPLSQMIQSNGLLVFPTDPSYCGYTDPNAKCYQGTSASGIAQGIGSVTYYDLSHGVINHPIRIAIQNACRTPKAPATRNPSDGHNWANCAQYGTKLKFDPTANVDAIRTGRRWCAPSGGYTQAEIDSWPAGTWPAGTPLPPGRSATDAAALGWDASQNCPLPPLPKMILKSAQDPSPTHYIVITDQAGNGAPNSPGWTFDIESYDRPRTQNWSSVPDGNPYSYWYGCDGYNNTGQWSGPPYNSTKGIPVKPGESESDCWTGTGQAWSGFPSGITQWFEIQ